MSTGTSEPFRLLNLPREIRDAIYHETLCDWPARGPSRHSSAAPPDRKVQLKAMARNKPNILLTNRMIYQEAKLVLLKGNKFVHVKMVARNSSLLTGAFVRSQVPLVATDREHVALFKDLVVMKYFIDFPEDRDPSPKTRIDVILLHKHIESFCHGLALVDIHSQRFAGQLSHTVTIFDPFTKTMSPFFLNPKNQSRLLEPYGLYLRGSNQFQVKGNVDPDLAKAVVANMRHEPSIPSPDVLLGKLRFRKGLADEAILDGDPLRAIVWWNMAHMTILAARNSKAWPRYKEQAGKEFTDNIGELAFQIHSSRAQAYLQVAQTDLLGDDSEEPFAMWMKQIYTACSDVLEIGNILGTDWKASDDQLATVFCCWAQALRLAEEDIQLAEYLINFAAEFRPGDPDICSEMKRVLKWKLKVETA